MPKQDPTKKSPETAEHKRLKAVLKEILGISGFKFDTEISLNFSGSLDPKGQLFDERSIDIAACGSSEGKRFLLIFECKGGDNFKQIHQKISSWESDLKKISDGKTNVIKSDLNAIKEADFSKLDFIKVCYVFGSNLDSEKFETIAPTLRKRGLYAWDNAALTYYKKTTRTVGSAAMYELLREFDVNLESGVSFHEKAIKIMQRHHEMYIFGAKPSVLLKIGYVSRRASKKPEAYQRILNKDRIKKISDFVSSKDALLPNAIIIAFDEEPAIQKEISYSGDGKLSFPSTYCSAWIIDGQHRVFGFLGTKLGKYNQDIPKEEFKLPVVAFRNLNAVLQNRTFVNINYNQKKIDPTLLCDLATAVPDLQNELTWPSLLVAELNKVEPLKDKVKISELDKGRHISISSFAQYGLLESLLGYDKKNRTYNGALFTYSKFKPKSALANSVNQKALKKQADLLKRFFKAVELNTKKPDASKNPWLNTKEYALLKPTGINALLLVLSRIMEKYPRVETDIKKDLDVYLKPLRKVKFTKKNVAKQGGGWKGFRGLANIILRNLNTAHGTTLRLFGEKEKK